ncbi:MAG: LysR family transcriptional regulator [Vicinamibacterales bacterium]
MSVLHGPVTALEVRHLALVSAIADTGSVTRAAERLHLTQSALSHQLRDVEARLETPLFLRLGRRMALTPAGERLLAAARRVLDDLVRTEHELRSLAAPDAGRLRLCTQCNTGYHWLPPLLEKFHTSYPAVEVQIVVAATDRPVEALLEGEIDLAFITDGRDDPRLATQPVFKDELVAVVAPSHPFARRPHVEPVDLGGTHLLLYNLDRRSSDIYRYVLTPAGVEPGRVSKVPLTEAILELIRAGQGIGIMARWAIEPALKAGTVRAVRIGRRGVFRAWKAATLRSRPEPKWQKDFVALMAAQAMPARAHRPRR